MAETNFKRKYMAYCWLTRREVTGRTPLGDGAAAEFIVLCDL